MITRKKRDGTEEVMPSAIQRYHKYAGQPGAFPHPTLVLERIPDHVIQAFVAVVDADNSWDRETARSAYMAILADEVMNQNPIPLKKQGPRVKHAGQNTDV